MRIKLDNPHRMRNLLQFWNESVATFTLDASVFGPPRLSFQNKSSLGKYARGYQSCYSIQVEAHQTQIYVSLCWTSGGDLPSCPIRGLPITANIKITMRSLSKGRRVHSRYRLQSHQSSTSHRHEGVSYRNQMLAA